MIQKKNKKSKKVFLYMRYSSEMQNYMSIEAQRRANKNFCRIVVCDDCIEVILKTKDENLKNAA